MSKYLLIQLLWLAIGRRNLARLGRFLSNGARLDVPNTPSSNGERTVQQRLLSKGQADERLCVFDVGANVGNWTLALLGAGERQGREIFIHAFEPCDETCVTLKRNLESSSLSQSVRVNNAALSSQTEKRLFYSVGSNMGINGLYPLMAEDPREQTLTKLETDTLDNYCVRNGISRIDYLKVDTEGHDLDVLYGGNDLFTTGGIDIAQFEYNQRWISARNYLRDAFDYFLPLGYELGKITPRGIEFYPAWDYELETFREGNYLVVKSAYKAIFPQIAWWGLTRYS